MRTVSFLCAVLVLLAGSAAIAAAGAAVTVTVDGKPVQFQDVEPFIDERDRTQVPVRFVSEELGAEVEWETETGTVTIEDAEKKVQFFVDEMEYTINGEEREMDTTARIVDPGRTVVPPRFVADALGLDIGWHPETRTVALETEKQPPPKTKLDLKEEMLLTEEQLQQIDEREEVIQLTEDQVARFEEYAEKLMEEVNLLLSEAEAARIEDALEKSLINNVINMQALEEVSELLYESVGKSQLGGGVTERAVLETEKGEKIALQENQEPLLAQDEKGCVINYIPPFDMSYSDCEDISVFTMCAHGANKYSGSVAAWTNALAGSVASWGMQGVEIDVPVDGTDLEITVKMLYQTGAADFGAAAAGTYRFAGAPEELQYDEIDVPFDWEWVIDKTIFVAGFASGVSPDNIGQAIDLADNIWSAYELNKALTEEKEGKDGTEEIEMHFSVESLDEGTYHFRTGLQAKSSGAGIGTSNSYAFGQVTDIQVRKDMPVEEIRITEDSQQMDIGETARLSAEVVYEDGTEEDITKIADWSSLEPDVATVEEGIVEAYSRGSTKIEVDYCGETADILVAVDLDVINNVTHPISVRSADLSPDDSMVVAAPARFVKVWDTFTGELISEFEHGFDRAYSVDFSSDGSMVVSGSRREGPGETLVGETMIWDAFNGDLITEFIEDEEDSDVRSVAFSSDDSMVVSGLWNNNARVRDVETGNILTEFREHRGSVESVAFSSDDSMIVSGSHDNTARVWDTETGDVITEFREHQASVHSVSFSSDDSTAVSGSYDNTVKVWDVETGEVITNFTEHGGDFKGVTSVDFSSDDSYVVSGAYDAAAIVWDVKTGEVVTNFRNHDSYVTSVVFSSDDSFVVSGSGDTTVKVWTSGVSTVPEPVYTVTFAEERPEGKSSTRSSRR